MNELESLVERFCESTNGYIVPFHFFKDSVDFKYVFCPLRRIVLRIQKKEKIGAKYVSKVRNCLLEFLKTKEDDANAAEFLRKWKYDENRRKFIEAFDLKEYVIFPFENLSQIQRDMPIYYSKTALIADILNDNLIKSFELLKKFTDTFVSFLDTVAHRELIDFLNEHRILIYIENAFQKDPNKLCKELVFASYAKANDDELKNALKSSDFLPSCSTSFCLFDQVNRKKFPLTVKLTDRAIIIPYKKTLEGLLEKKEIFFKKKETVSLAEKIIEMAKSENERAKSFIVAMPENKEKINIVISDLQYDFDRCEFDFKYDFYFENATTSDVEHILEFIDGGDD